MDKDSVNQESIARALGISRSTVTKVLNHDPVYRVSAETRELVLRTAAEMGFRLRRRRTGNIGFVVCGEVHSAMHEIHQAVCQEAGALGYRVFFVNKPANPTYRDISLSVNPLASDGAILVGAVDAEVAQRVAEVTPLVAVDPFEPIPQIDNILADHRKLARRLSRVMIEAGHTRIAVIVDTKTGEHNRPTLRGCKAEQEAAGIKFDPKMVWEKRGQLYPALIREIVDYPSRPTAILAFTTSDHPVILSTLFALGKDVPDDISYVGWATSYFSSLSAFPLVTCLDSYHQTLARAAVRRLLDRIDHRDMAVEQVTVDVGVREGESVKSKVEAARP